MIEHEIFKMLLKNSKNMQKTLFKPKPLTVSFVFSNLKEIALSAGHSVSHAIVRTLAGPNTCYSLKERKYLSSRSSLLRVKAKRQSILSGV